MKFRIKITICMIWLLSLAFGIGSSLLISSSFNNALELEKTSAFSSYQMTLNTLQLVNDVSSQADYSHIADTLIQLDNQSSANWTALRLSSADTTIYEDGMIVEYMDFNTAIDSEHCKISIFQDTNGTRYLQLSGQIATDNDTLYLDIAYDISPIYESRLTQQSTYQKIFVFLVLIGAGLSWGISFILTRPLSQLSKASQKIASGNLSYRSRIRSNDELGMLSSDFNAMADKLEENFLEIQAAMERQESFVASFAHELKTPMTSIIGYADLLRSQTLSPYEQMDAANYIFSEGKRFENLSLKLLDILILDQDKTEMTAVSPAQLISNLAEHTKPIFVKKNITLQYKCENGFCLLDTDLVNSLLVNLLDNAKKAIKKSGNIYIISNMLEDGCRIRIFDTGCGIPPESLSHLTEAFYRVDKSRSRTEGGVGLGLALCNKIVKLHNGTLQFDSRVGNGTCVTVELRGGRT